MAARGTLVRTLRQAVELGLALLLVSTAIHRTGSTSALLLAFAIALGATAFASPGLLAARALLRPKGQQLAEILVALGCVAGTVIVTRTDVVATAPLLLTALVLYRLARLPMVDLPTAAGPQPTQSRYQPTINRLARAAGVFVRSQRRADSPNEP